LAVINRIKIKQRARIKWLQLGDVNMKFFHLGAAHRKQNNRIQSLQTEEGLATSPSELEEAMNSFFTTLVGTDVPSTNQFNWDELNLPVPDLSELAKPFTLEEVKAALFDTPTDRAPGPDSFSVGFFRTSWEVIKEDLMLAVKRVPLA
jgi:hypothetical protein